VSPLAERAFDLLLHDRVRFGTGAIEGLPGLIREIGATRAFIVTDPGVQASGVVARVVEVLEADGIETGVFAEVEPNPGAATVERGAKALRAFGATDVAVIPVGGGSAMDTAKALSLRAMNDASVWELGYDDLSLVPGRPIIAVPTTAGTGAETNAYGVITDEAVGRKAYIAHPSLLPAATILDPVLTLGLPPAATAATGIDALTHALESLLSANPNPFADALALAVIRTVANWLPRAVDDGSDLEARSQMLLASHLAGVGQASGTGVGLVHALGHALGTRGRLPHGTALATILPEVLSFYGAVRDRELGLVAIELGVRAAGATDSEVRNAAIEAIAGLCSRVGQRRTLRDLGLDRAIIDELVADALADGAIRNAPRQPTAREAARILESVAG
jgi:alcohol dehydrogenase